MFEDVVGDFTSGRVSGGILVLDFHLEDFVGAFVGVDLDMRKECNETFLEGVKASFDFAFGVRGRGNEVSDANGSKCPLEMTARVEVIE